MHAAPKEPELPVTGDGSNLALWLVLVVLGLGAAAFFGRSVRKKEN